MRCLVITLLLRCVLPLALAGACHAAENPALAATTRAEVDAAVQAALRAKGVPGASIALVVDGRIAYVKAYGLAQVQPPRQATPEMRFGIGSISKQFLAAGLLMLETEGRLNLDDPASKYVADLGPAGCATLRQLLSHTSGLPEYMPHDYVAPAQRVPVQPSQLVLRAARQAQDFAPGERWRYSNTGYALAGLVFEAVAGEPLAEGLRRRIFAPLKMASVIDSDQHALTAGDVTGYSVLGLAAPEPATPMAPGWMFGAGGLAMTAEDLARWSLALIDRSLLAPSAQRALESDTRLNSGAGTRYGLGLVVRMIGERRVLGHDGGVPGFGSASLVLPDERMAIVVLTNADYGEVAPDLAARLHRMLLNPASPQDSARTAQDRQVLLALQGGRIDRKLFTANANDYFSDGMVAQTAAALKSAGELKQFRIQSRSHLGGIDARVYAAEMERQRYTVVTRAWPDGRLEQFTLSPD